MERVVFLDFGGTLDGDGSHWSVQFEEAFAAAGLAVPAASLREAFLASDRMLTGAPGIERMGLGDHVRLQVRTMLAHVDLDVGHAGRIADCWLASARLRLAAARAALARHHGRLRFGIVSNFTANLPVILAEEGLAELFDCVIVSETVKARKPEPAIFRLALDAMACAPADAAMVGDSFPADIRGAKAVGLTTVWVRGGDAKAGERPAEVDYTVRDVAEALDLLAEAA